VRARDGAIVWALPLFKREASGESPALRGRPSFDLAKHDNKLNNWNTNAQFKQDDKNNTNDDAIHSKPFKAIAI